MKDYLKQFASVTIYNTWKNSENYIAPNVSHILDNNVIHYQPIVNHDSQESGSGSGSGSGNADFKDYLTFTALEDTTFKFTTNALQYSLDDGTTWTTLDANTSTPTITAGNKILWKQTGLTPNVDNGIGTFSSTGQFNVSGNIMSLYYDDDFGDKIDLTGKDYAFAYLFNGCSKLVNAENLILPATTLSDYCYYRMFQDCTSLTTAPELPATTLAYDCYEFMFESCTSLTTAPELPATTLATSCYYSMFKDCTSLTIAPELPATTLTQHCYKNMFNGCTSLTTAPELPATTLANYCYRSMFSGCSSLNYIKCLATDISANYSTYYWVYDVSSTGTFVKADSMSSWTIGNNGIPTGWTVQDESGSESGLGSGSGSGSGSGNADFKDYLTFTALEDTTFKFTTNALQYSLDDGTTWTTLDANTSTPTITAGNKILWKQTGLTPDSSYGIGNFSSTGRFNVSGNIMSLYYDDDFTDLTDKDYAFAYLFMSCSKLVNAENLILPATTLAYSCYGSMFQGCDSLTTAPALPATTLADYCYSYMFEGCSSLTTAPALQATTLAYACYEYMFEGCSSLTTAPALPATTLASYCYSDMFSNCSSLTTAPALPATTLANECYAYMFAYCSSLTTAPELPATVLAEYCYNNMFEECTSLTTAPELPATTLANYCYNQMFYRCDSLTTAPELPATTLARYCYESMFTDCTSLNYIKCLATNISATNCTYWWVDNVSSTGTFVKDASMSSWTTGNNGIPTGWTVQDESGSGSGSGSGNADLHDYSQDYFTTTALEDNTIFTFDNLNISDAEHFGYSLDNGKTWVNETTTPSIHTGEKVLWKLDRINGQSGSGSGSGSGSDSNQIPIYSSFSCINSSGNFEVSGNIMSLLYGDDFAGQTDLTGKNYAFSRLFYNCNKMVNAENLILPSTTLADYCYSNMFEGCSSLTTAPELPATTLASYCYEYMFNRCSSLTSAPILPATTLAEGCYNNMFDSCTSLTTALELPATTLTNWCYRSMFDSCTSLTTAPELPATTLAQSCYEQMFYGCTSLTTAPELPATTLTNECYQYMFYNCTSLIKAPELPATILAQRCYQQMFKGCTSLTTAPELHVTTLANNCYNGMFDGCTSLTIAPELPATTLANGCYYCMFYGCTSLTTAPELPATTLTAGCYFNMFYDCTSLNYIKCLATDISANNSTYYWVENVSSTGTFVKANSMSSWNSGMNGIPTGWTVQNAA